MTENDVKVWKYFSFKKPYCCASMQLTFNRSEVITSFSHFCEYPGPPTWKHTTFPNQGRDIIKSVNRGYPLAAGISAGRNGAFQKYLWFLWFKTQPCRWRLSWKGYNKKYIRIYREWDFYLLFPKLVKFEFCRFDWLNLRMT